MMKNPIAVSAATLLAISFIAPAASAEDPDPNVRHVEKTDALARITAAASPLEKDRQAILAMQGEYETVFDFDETVAYQPGYARKPHSSSAGYEWVFAVEDTPHKIVLQHILVSATGEHVVKHWRQDWTYQATRRLEFSEDQTWRLRDIAAEKVTGGWTQCVYEVSDAPRYCGTGRWEHGFASTWTSDLTWRPLPRREFTKRDDYNALQVVNRHRIVAAGWTHEQDNIKVRREGEKPVAWIAGEQGFNDYRAITGHDFAPGRKYWKGTASYWAKVRAEWDRRIQADGGIRITLPQKDMTPIMELFAQAEEDAAGRTVSDQAIAGALDRWTARP